MKTLSQMEAEISHAIVTFEKQHMGRGPTGIRTHLLEDLVIVRLRGILTPAEQELARTGDLLRGTLLIKSYRTELLEKARKHLDAIIEEVTGRKVTSLHTDISTATGERIIVFALDGAPDVSVNGRNAPKPD
jgi:uncharacterized protein YbcI